MRTFGILLAVSLSLAACTRTAKVHGPPVVDAGPDLSLPAQTTVVLGAVATGSARISTISWTLVSAPASAEAAIVQVTGVGDVATLRTAQESPGLYVIAVTATDEDGLTSEPDFLNIEQTSPSDVLPAIALSCEGCRAGTAGLEADESTTLTFAVEVLAGNSTGIRWTYKLQKDAKDGSNGTVTITPSDDGLSARVDLPQVYRDATLTLAATAFVSGVGDTTEELVVKVLDSADEPPAVTLNWHIPGGKTGVRLLPGDAIHVKATVVDPNGDAVVCTFPTADGMVHVAVTDPCGETVFPLEAGTYEYVVEVTTPSRAGVAVEEKISFDIAPFRTVAVTGGANSVALTSAGDLVATTGAGSYLVADATDPGLAVTRVTASQSGTKAVAINGPTALVGFSGSKNLGRYDLTAMTSRSDLAWTDATPTGTVAMASSGATSRVWVAMNQGIGLYEDIVTPTLSYWAGGGVTPSAIAWGAITIGSSLKPYVWYADHSDVYRQAGEDLGAWDTNGKGPIAVTVNHPVITALSFGSTKTTDLWIGTGPTGAAMTGFPLILYKDAVNPATGSLQMNAKQEFFAPMEGGVSAVAVEADGAYAGDAWVVAGGKIVRVSRVIADEKTGTRSAVALELRGMVMGTKIAGLAVAGRKVAVATEQGLAVLP